MVSPVVLKLKLENLIEAGNVMGKIYAFSTTSGNLPDDR